ncbi:hypothetical protein [Marinimicrobium koreense]|uniref:hypothetical protein n=1 Tax=Marinimicrobium koreense TaxID=306545 RepID=UPI000F4CA504|nr:hypothetical protein [Marinimicrobium koreense]
MQELLAIIEVDSGDRVLCCAPECKRSVYKRVHVVRDNSQILVFGQTCFRGIYSDLVSAPSKYTGFHSKVLTEEERRLLVENTEALILRFENEFSKGNSIELASESSLVGHRKNNTDHDQGSGRDVLCHYCGKMMVTHIQHVPAMGFKCQVCKDNRERLPVRGKIKR